MVVFSESNARSVLWFTLGFAVIKLVSWGGGENLRVNSCDVGVKQSSDYLLTLGNEVFLQTPVWTPYVMPLFQR